MSEEEVRQGIVRLVQLKSIPTHHLGHNKSVYPKKCSEEQVQKISKCQTNIIHWCGARQIAFFLTLEHYKNMLAAGKKERETSE